MSKFSVRLSSAAVIALMPFAVAGAVNAQGYTPSTAKGDWPMYFADPTGSRYSPQDQITAANFNKLELAWHFKTDAMGSHPEYKLEGTPVEVNGTVYTTAGSRRAVVALDAKTGELKWVYSMVEGLRAAIAPRQLSGRGVSYWTDGKGDDRILYVTTGYRLVELNAKTGQPVDGFGEHGVVDLKVGAYTGVLGQPGVYKQIDLITGEIGLHSTPTVVNDTVLVGSSFKEGSQPLEQNNTKGLTRAFDVKTGKLIWTFHNIPQKGEFGYESWDKNAADFNGNTGTWTGMTVDKDAGIVYAGIEDPTDDYYGGGRPGNDLFGDSIVALDFATGKMKWYYQVVHHPIWDMDMSSPPLLVDINVAGKPVKAVAVPSKQCYLYTFDRISGKPVWPITEKPVPQTDVPGEKTSKTQPFPSKPAYCRNAVTEADLIDYSPELNQKAKDIIKANYKMSPIFGPAVVSSPTGYPKGTLLIGYAGGGTNWPGAGFNPESATVFAPAVNDGVSGLGLVPLPEGLSDLKYDQGMGGQVFRIAGAAGFGDAPDAPKVSLDDQKLAAALAAHPQKANGPPPPRDVSGLPFVKPPYGLLTAINVNTGDQVWQVANGDTPDSIKNNPALKGLNVPAKTGHSTNVGVAVTKSLVVSGDGEYVTAAGHPRGAYLRAWDQKTGAEVGAVYMPAPQSGSPMTYSYDGKQYIMVAVSGGNYSGDYLAYALPQGQ